MEFRREDEAAVIEGRCERLACLAIPKPYGTIVTRGEEEPAVAAESRTADGVSVLHCTHHLYPRIGIPNFDISAYGCTLDRNSNDATVVGAKEGLVHISIMFQRSGQWLASGRVPNAQLVPSNGDDSSTVMVESRVVHLATVL
jgi:hypothetical protein